MYMLPVLFQVMWVHSNVSTCLLQLDALGEVVDAVAGRCEVYLDGGVRLGTDVLKALALGARAVFIGRPAIYGVAYNVTTSRTRELIHASPRHFLTGGALTRMEPICFI